MIAFVRGVTAASSFAGDIPRQTYRTTSRLPSVPLARERPPRPMFDRGTRYADLVARGVLQPRLVEPPPGAAGR